MNLELVKFIPWLPALAAVLCGLCCLHKRLRPFAPVACLLGLAGAFVMTLLVMGNVPAYSGDAVAPHTVTAFRWINVASLHADMAYFLDPLTVIMLLVVTGIGSLVAVYAAGYMKGDRGYARFFAFVSLFIFAMTTLVMADNLVLLYLGWEGVGLCSYLLIGFYYKKPSAVAAAKKAFIVNRIGDLGFALGIFWIYYSYHTVNLSEILQRAHEGGVNSSANTWIPFLLMLGAFGKSAQIPLYVWLPDAMEGPTPVSALIHAATMVTAGVYMIARLTPLFALSPHALTTVAVIGAATALFAATIALCQYDIKRVFAYSTISQLGYMFLAVGVGETVGGMFHLVTHAFFKALLFLTAGSVMHALTGQLDLRKMSGLRAKMPVTCWLMFAGCLALAGFPFTSGFFSKDMILAAAMEKGLGEQAQLLYRVLAITGLVVAFLTAYYTFRVWFRVFLGPVKYEMGNEHHDEAESHQPHGTTPAKSDIQVVHHHEPHEMPFLPMNAPLCVLAVGALLAGYFCEHWIGEMVRHSTAGGHAPEAGPHATLMGMNLHTAMMWISSGIALLGIAVAAYFHWLRRDAADAAAREFPAVVKLLANKYYIDEINNAVIVRPLRLIADVFYIIDRLIIDGLVTLVGLLPRLLGKAVTPSPSQRGRLQGYGLGMILGTAVVVFLIFRMLA